MIGQHPALNVRCADLADVIPEHFAHAAQMPSTLTTMHLHLIDGAVHRVGEGETASVTGTPSGRT